MNHRSVAKIALAAVVTLSVVTGLGVALSATDASPAAVEPSPADVEVRDRPDPSDLRNVGGSVDATESTDASDAADNRTVGLVSTTEHVRFDAAKDQVLRGEATLPTGTQLMVVVVNEGPGDFVAIENTRVGLDGTFREELDLSHFPENGTARVLVYHEGEPVLERTATMSPSNEGTRIDAEWNKVVVGQQHATISGTTDLSAGTELEVTVHSGGDYEFEHTETVTVRQNGRFEATFDFTEVPHASDFRISVSHDGTRLDYAHGTVYD